MSSERCVTILNVGHGNATVIRDGSNVVVVDTGGEHAGGRLLDYLRSEGHNVIDALLLSHADEDHIGNAPTLLLAKDITIRHVFVNSDSTKRTNAFRELQVALGIARRERNTNINPALTIAQSHLLAFGGMQLEVLFPPPEYALTGPGGKDIDERTQSTNSMSAVIRVTCGTLKVLLPADSDHGAINFWREEKLDPASQIVVFPHHGGRPGKFDPAGFAKSFVEFVKPTHVIFSIHVEKHGLPREDVVGSIFESCPDAHMICTQLPSRLTSLCEAHPWLLHTGSHGVVSQLNVRISDTAGIIVIPNLPP